MQTRHTHSMHFDVKFEYPVLFGHDVLTPDSVVLRDVLQTRSLQPVQRALAFVDAGLAAAQPGLVDQIQDYFAAHGDVLELAATPIVVPGGEAVKNDYRKIMEMVDAMLEHRIDRQAYVMVFGGGAVVDAVGFAASLVHRGLRLIRFPSTVLAQNDAGIGVKNGMNLHGGKNTVGTFAPPFAVINDLRLLDSLDDTHWRSGLAEAFKVAIIKDAAFFDEMCTLAPKLRARDAAAMERSVIRCAELHLDHIASNGDPFEMGSARPLDFGHWAAHKLEGMSNYRIPHGMAVSAGVALDSAYAAAVGKISTDDRDRIIAALQEAGLPVFFPEMGRTLGDGSLEVLQGLEEFREHLGGLLCVTLPHPVGDREEVHEVDLAVMADCVQWLQQVAAPPVD